MPLLRSSRFFTSSRFFCLAIVFFLAVSCCYAQRTLRNEDRALLVTGGFGLTYGVFGINVEYGQKRWAAFIDGGYIPPFTIPVGVLPAAFNFGGGIWYTFARLDGFAFRGGLYCGWVDEYYSSAIGLQPYEPVVYGTAVMGGIQYRSKYLVLKADVDWITPLIFNAANHPHYLDVQHIGYSVGVGVNLFAFFKPSRARAERRYERLAGSRCIEKEKRLPRKMKSGACGNLMFYQQLDSIHTLLFYINPDSVRLESDCRTYSIDSTNQNLRVWLVTQPGFSDSLQCMACELAIPPGAAKAYRGTLTIILNHERLTKDNSSQFRFSAQVDDLYFIEKESGKEVVFPQIVIWDMKDKTFCAPAKAN
jgi:hypothetical protein